MLRVASHKNGDIEKAEHLYKEAMKHGYYNEDLVLISELY